MGRAGHLHLGHARLAAARHSRVEPAQRRFNLDAHAHNAHMSEGVGHKDKALGGMLRMHVRRTPTWTSCLSRSSSRCASSAVLSAACPLWLSARTLAKPASAAIARIAEAIASATMVCCVYTCSS